MQGKGGFEGESKPMRKLIWVIVILTAGWGAIWFAGSKASEALLAGWLEDRAAEGWLVNYAELSTGGFPSLLRTEISQLQLADPETGWAWEAPLVILQQRPLRADQVTAIWPDQQSLASPFERLEITSSEMTSDLDLRPSANLALDLSETQLRDLAIASSAGWSSSLRTGTLVAQRVEGEDQLYDLVFEAEGYVPPEGASRILDPAGLLPQEIETLRIEGQFGFDGPWDLDALEVARPQFTSIELEEAQAVWGDMRLRASGDLVVDSTGRPAGEIAIRAENWRAMLDLGVNAGVITTEARRMIERGLGFLAGLGGDPDNLDAPLSFRDGLMFFGPIPIGQAPQFVLR